MNDRSVVFFNRFYWPDHAATAQILSDLAEYLAARYWDVTVVTSTARYAGGDAALATTEVHNGVNIHRVATPRADRSRVAGSLAAYGAYTAGALRHQVRLRGHPIVVALTDPPMLAAALLPLARARRSRLVHWVQDIHPEVAARVGPLPNGLLYDSVRTLAGFTNRHADLTVTIGPAMSEYLAAHGTPAERLEIIPNWVDTNAVRPLAAGDNELASELGLQEKFVVLYSGNAARAHPLDAVLDAMRRLRDRNDIVFVFIGGGPGHATMRAAAASEQLPNVQFLDSLPRERIAESHGMADVCLVTESPDVAGLLYPSKSMGIMASGRPLVFIGDERSEVARAVHQHACGVVIAPGDGDALVRAIGSLQADPATAATLGANGRRAAMSVFDRDICCAAWEAALSKLARR